jgi:DNA-binding response OmpR family regulator
VDLVGESKRVLVVEADEALAELITLILHDVGYVADGVANVEDALDYFQAEPLPAVILLDICLPGTSGLSLVQACRQSDRLSRLPMLVLTGRPVPEFADGLAPDVVMQKPFDIDRLCAAVGRITRTPRPASANAVCLPHRSGRVHAR